MMTQGLLLNVKEESLRYKMLSLRGLHLKNKIWEDIFERDLWNNWNILWNGHAPVLTLLTCRSYHCTPVHLEWHSWPLKNLDKGLVRSLGLALVPWKWNKACMPGWNISHVFVGREWGTFDEGPCMWPISTCASWFPRNVTTKLLGKSSLEVARICYPSPSGLQIF